VVLNSRKTEVAFVIDTNVIIHSTLQYSSPFAKELAFFNEYSRKLNLEKIIIAPVYEELNAVLDDIFNYVVEIYRGIKTKLEEVRKGPSLPVINSFFKNEHRKLSAQAEKIAKTVLERKRTQLRIIESELVINIYRANAFQVKDAISYISDLMIQKMNDLKQIKLRIVSTLHSEYKVLSETIEEKKTFNNILNSMEQEQTLKNIHRSDKTILSRVYGYQMLNNKYYIFVTLDYTLINMFEDILSNNYMIFISTPLYAIYKALELEKELPPQNTYTNYRSSIWWKRVQQEKAQREKYII